MDASTQSSGRKKAKLRPDFDLCEARRKESDRLHSEALARFAREVEGRREVLPIARVPDDADFTASDNIQDQNQRLLIGLKVQVHEDGKKAGFSVAEIDQILAEVLIRFL